MRPGITGIRRAAPRVYSVTMSNPTEFGALALKPALQRSLTDLGYTEMTLVQAQALPSALAGVDLLARAKTGSGKTAAFGLALLNKLEPGSFRTQALVLCPTRELADQVTNEIRRLASCIPNVKVQSLCGGVPLGPQIASLQHSAHVVVGTPGRVLKHLDKKTLSLSGLRTFVLDEADRMLDMGFMDELDAILKFLPAKRQTLLFSATYPEEIAGISARVQRKPIVVDVTEAERPALITQHWCAVTQDDRQEKLVQALRVWGGELNLVFCNTKIDCANVAKYLQNHDIVAVALHGDLDQTQRTQTLTRFANRSASVLIATDVAARGLDVKDLDAVFNYELPSSPEVYIHRIGRTARAGKRGVAVSLVAPWELRRLPAIEAQLPAGALQESGIPDSASSADALLPAMVTIEINGGRKNKLRPGDVLGALTADGGVPGVAVGSIDLTETRCYVAVREKHAGKALRQLAGRKIKGRQYRARLLH